MDLFGFKKRKAQRERLAAFKTKRIKEEFKILKERAEQEAERESKQSQELANRVNDKCPKCGSKNVNDRIKRLQGEFSGDMEGSIYRSGYVHGHSEGSIDTNPVNKCECGHEWKKREVKTTWTYEALKDIFERLHWMLEDYHKAYNAKLDPNDLDETFESDEEKRKDLLKKCDEGTQRENLLKFFKDIHLETIKETAEKEIYGGLWSSAEKIRDFYEIV